PFAVHLAAILVHRADAVHGLVLLPQPLARLTRVQQVVEPAGAGGGEPVEGGVEAVLLGAGAVAGPLGAVVDLAEVAGAVAVRTQQLGQHRLGGGREGGVVEPVPAPALLVGAGDEPRAGGGADRGGDVGAVEPRPALGEPVEVRGAGVRAAARGEIAVAVVVRDDQQDVGAGGRGGRHAVLRGGCTGPSTPTAPSSVGGRGGAWWPIAMPGGVSPAPLRRADAPGGRIAGRDGRGGSPIRHDERCTGPGREHRPSNQTEAQ